MDTNSSDIEISVIVPVYNAKEYIYPCIESIYGQKSVNIEVILIDDGSTDGTSEVCNKIAEDYQTIRVIHTVNMGVSHARNIGIEAASGKYVSFVDVDDTIEDGIFEQLLDDIKQNDCDMACIGYKEVHVETGQVVNKFGTEQFWVWEDALRQFLTDIKISWMVWAKLYKRDIIADIKFPVDKAIAEDMFFIFQVCRKAKKVCYRDKCMYRYMVHDKSVMNKKLTNKNFDVPKLINKVYEDVVAYEPQRKDEAEQFQLRYMLWFYRFICLRMDEKDSFEEELSAVRKIIINYNLKKAFNYLNKKYFGEYLLVRFSLNLYRKMIRRYTMNIRKIHA